MAKSIAHNIFPDLDPRAELFEKVGFLEKSWLNQTHMGFPEQVLTLSNHMQFFQVKGVQAVWDEKNEFLQSIGFSPSFFSGMYNMNLPVMYVIYSKNSRLQIYLGTIDSGSAALTSLLETTFGRSLYSQESSLKAPITENFMNCSSITGIPTPLDTGKMHQPVFHRRSTADALISGMTGMEWVFCVQAFPIQRQQINRWLESCSREIKDIKEAFLLREIQKSNRMATYYTEILEKSIKRLTFGNQQGIWQTGTYLFSKEPEAVAQAAALLSSVYAGSKSSPEPVRSHICTRTSPVSPFINCYHSKELCCFAALPTREFPGFRLLEQAGFDVDFTPDEHDSLLVGHVMGENRTYDFPCSIPVADLTKHGLIAGVTGSGKTNTVFHLLTQLHQSHQLPFMVIEPAKSEYRNLLNDIDSLLVFTLGEERPGISSPFRMNPFYFPDGISIQTHIDYLKAVFNASFGMYAPMPYILEECLYKIYQDKGWHLVTSLNSRGKTLDAFPTLSDLYAKIEVVVDQIGYHDRIAMDIKAALKTRINNLCIGGKGMMLNTSASIPFSRIMSRPTVFELKYLGNDEEKAFMMGLILMAVWEYHESMQASRNISANRLNHLLVIEEAHRLLKNVPTEKVSEEQSNIKGKGVETFCNLLAEMRAYGEGVLVSEQIPVKLAPDVIKNSNFKIMHRLVAKEDRDFMGDTMCLTAGHKRHAVRLETGEAIFFREGFDRSLKVKVPVVQLKEQNRLISDKAVRDSMQITFFNKNKHLLMRFASCSQCPHLQTDACEKNRTKVEDTIRNPGWPLASAMWFAPGLIHPATMDRRDFNQAFVSDHPLFYHCMASHLITHYVNAKADYFGWSYEFVGEMIIEALNTIDQQKSFMQTIGNRCSDRAEKGPYRLIMCETFCTCRRLFCYEGHLMTKDPQTHNNLVDILNSKKDGNEFYDDLAALILDFVMENLPSCRRTELESLCICYLIQKMHEHQFPLKKQQLFLKKFNHSLYRTATK